MASGTDGTSHATRAAGLPITDGSSPCSSCCDDPSVASDPRSRHERIVTRARSARTIPAPRHLQACSNCRQHGSAFGACCCAGKLRSPAPPTVRDDLTRPDSGTSTGTSDSTQDPTPNHTQDPTHATRVPHLAFGIGVTAGKSPCGGPVARKNRGRLAPLGGVERPHRAVRFARLIQRRGRDLGGPSVRVAFGDSLSLT